MRTARKFSFIFISLLIIACLLFSLTSCTPKTINTIKLCNKNSTPETIRLYDYILSTYKHKIISGQQESTWTEEGVDYEVDYIHDITDKYPAIRGFDFIDDDFDGVVNRAIDWADKGGIVTICWHCSSALDAGYNESKISMPQEKWDAILTKGSQENIEFFSAMDKAGSALKRLQDENIPVIWRPYHECDGWWFWWSLQGGEYFKRLWIMSYEHFTNDLGLNNLIWMLGFSHVQNFNNERMEQFFPGNEYFDIIGADSYDVEYNGAENLLFDGCYALVDDSKPIAFHETGVIPTIEQFKEVPWAYFMTWHTSYLTEKNSPEFLHDFYNDPYVITLEDLPDFYKR